MTRPRSETRPAVNPEMILLARESRGLTLTDLAERMSVTPGFVSQIENGIRFVTAERLAMLARVLEYPESFFALQDPIRGLGASLLFHRRRRRVPMHILRSAHARANIALIRLARMLRYVETPALRILPMDLEDYGRRVADVAQSVRTAWGLPLGPVKSTVRTIEAAGGVVISFAFGTRDIDALSIAPPDLPPVFFVNPDAPADRLRFSLCHELGHVLMHRRSVPEREIEAEADAFAAEFLMPADDIRADLSGLDLPKVAALKPYWRVSMAALIRRAADLGAISNATERRLWMAMSRLGYRRREPDEIAIPQESEKPRLYEGIVDCLRGEMGFGETEFGNLLYASSDELPTLLSGHLRRPRLVS